MKYFLLLSLLLVINFGSVYGLKSRDSICHVDEETGIAKLLTLPNKAALAHLQNHADDAEPGGEPSESGISYDDFCNVIAPPFVFIRVYKENSPGDLELGNDYDAADSLYVEVVDTSGDNILGPGDKIKVYKLASDISGGTIDVQINEHNVDQVTEQTENTIRLRSGQFNFFRYNIERQVGPSFFYDSHSEVDTSVSVPLRLSTAEDLTANDNILITPDSPSLPNTEDIIRVPPPQATPVPSDDDPWLEVKFYAPVSATPSP